MIFVSRLFQFLRFFRYIASSKAELILKIAALEHQVTVLKKKNTRPKISRVDRIIWVWLRCLWKNWKDVLYFVRPNTVIRWFRKGHRLYWRSISERGKGKRKGRPSLEMEIVVLIARLAKENVTWRAPRIHGELLKLGYKVSERTVSRYLRMFRTKISKNSKWMTFLRNQQKGIAAMDFYVEPTVLFKRLFVFFIISHDRREIIHFAVTYHPTALWVSLQIQKAFSTDKWSHIKYLIHDRDAVFSRLACPGISVNGSHFLCIFIKKIPLFSSQNKKVKERSRSNLIDFTQFRPNFHSDRLMASDNNNYL